ncbi:hypothetical protein EDD15DRAFT_2211972 [Pisolithus albus]|nr:hypothetical protein EDD15DRAFT_2211972 [Pisolithus albus]
MATTSSTPLNVPNESSRQSTPGGTTATANVTLPARHDFFSRPRLTISRFPTFQDTPNLAMNRLGFRYVPAGVAPAGSALPCRTIESGPTKFRVSWEDRSTFVKVTPDGLGFARCNAPIREGAVVYGGTYRMRWRRSSSRCTRRQHARGESCSPWMGAQRSTTERTSRLGRIFLRIPGQNGRQERIPIEFKGQEYFESLEYAQSKEMIALMEYSHKASSTASLPSVPAKKAANAKSLPERKGSGPETPVLRSHIAFFVNGECQKIAFDDLTSASRKDKENSKKRAREGAPREHKENPYDDGTLGTAPKRRRDIKPSCERTWRPICERYPEFMQEQWDLDAREEEEAKVDMALRAERLKAEAAKQVQKERRKRQTEAKKRAKELETRQASVTAASIPRTSIEREAMADFGDNYKPVISSLLAAEMQLPEEVEMAHSPAPTATPSVDYRVPYAGSEYESEPAEGEGEAGDGHGGQYGDVEVENRSDGVPSIDLELEELL